ncbi:hypothetical protein NDU88_002983 [Pleurodeles waltl]|uniref:Uncharacterized protein n=1 Tax=Pleurodeles waltl TaxID=8319 RepID=A0AAV7TNF0_PLEWA|nr:hypothetical protein NDU88_002983 [Pleurodeles waltl]
MRLGQSRPVSPRAGCLTDPRAHARPHAPRGPLTTGPSGVPGKPHCHLHTSPGAPLPPPGLQTVSAGPRRSKPRVTPRDHGPLGPYLRGRQPPSSPARRRALPSPSGLLDTPPSARPLSASGTAGLCARRLRARPGPERLPPSSTPDPSSACTVYP